MDTVYAIGSVSKPITSALVAELWEEDATGRPFLDLLDERVFKPLGMTHTTADNEQAVMRATDYLALLSDSAVLPAPETNSSYKWAGGGLVSTPTDLARFGIAMIRNELLNEATSKVVFTAREIVDGELNPQHYGLGLRWLLTR